jgi:hypothetical protein
MVAYDSWEQQHDYERAWEGPEDAESRRESMKDMHTEQSYDSGSTLAFPASLLICSSQDIYG